jgi:putative oxidoreductase
MRISVEVRSALPSALPLVVLAFVPALLALYVPWLEAACAGGLMFAAWRRGAWLIAWGLSLGFCVFVTSAWLRGLDVTCGCFGGTSARPLEGLTVARTVILLAIATAGFTCDRESPSPGTLAS